MRNILGERVLGLPGDVRVDRAPLERRPQELTPAMNRRQQARA